MKLWVRNLTPDDIERLVQLCNTVIGPDLITRPDIEEDISRSEDPMNDILVAEFDDRVIGYIQLVPNESENMIGPIVENLQISWAASEILLERAKKIAREKGWRYLQTTRNSKDKWMVRVLLANGFEIQRSFWNLHALFSYLSYSAFKVNTEQVSIKGLDSDEELTSLTDMINLIFHNSWGYSRMEVEDVKGWISRINARGDGIFLALKGGRLVGFLIMDLSLYLLDQGTAYIALLGVHPEYRGRGIGRALVYAAFERMRERELTGIQVTVDTSNENALGFYESLGFRKGYQLYFLRYNLG